MSGNHPKMKSHRLHVLADRLARENLAAALSREFAGDPVALAALDRIEAELPRAVEMLRTMADELRPRRPR